MSYSQQNKSIANLRLNTAISSLDSSREGRQNSDTLIQLNSDSKAKNCLLMLLCGGYSSFVFFAPSTIILVIFFKVRDIQSFKMHLINFSPIKHLILSLFLSSTTTSMLFQSKCYQVRIMSLVLQRCCRCSTFFSPKKKCSFRPELIYR